MVKNTNDKNILREQARTSNRDQSDLPFRDRALTVLKEVLGEPERLPATGGVLYRWILERSNGLSMYVTLDSPEMPELAHLIISDPQSTQNVEPVVSKTMRTIEEVEAIAQELVKQWKTEIKLKGD
jgi:hypothetical protein